MTSMKHEVSMIEIVKAILEGGGSISRCRVCLGDTQLGYMGLYECVQLRRSYCKPQLTLFELLTALGIPISFNINRSSVLCLNCTNAAVNAYIFREYCIHSQRLWTRVEGALAQCDLKALENRRKPVCIVLNDPPKMLDKLPVPKAYETKCSKCGRVFGNNRSVKRHSCKQTKMFSCPHCQRMFNTRFKYQVHLDRAHGQKMVQCESCPRQFASSFLVAEHRKAMHVLGECSVCGKQYTTRKGLRDHELTHTLEWVCVCGRVYKYREGLRLHEARCSALGQKNGTAEFPCPHCQKTYGFKHTLQQHIKFVHSDCPIRCEFCDKKFLTHIALRNHMSAHTGVKNYSCKQCNATFVSTSTLKYHMRACHTGEKPYACDQCSESFITSFRRTEHMRRKHGAPAPTCPECGATFTTLAALRRHRVKHAPPPVDVLTDNTVHAE